MLQASDLNLFAAASTVIMTASSVPLLMGQSATSTEKTKGILLFQHIEPDLKVDQ